MPVTWALFAAITIDIDPVAFSLGPLEVHWYGIGYVVAIAVGLAVVLPYARARGLTEDIVWDTFPWVTLAGLAGGRIYYVIQNDPGSYLSDPARIFAVWEGGMAFFGAVFAVIATIVFLAWRNQWPLLRMLDVMALAALVGQTIGRLGNVVNGDVLGPATDLPWGFIYAHPDSFAPDTTTAFHPASVYAIMANLVLIGLLVPFRHRLAPGWFAVAYVAGYAVSQLIVFGWRTEPEIVLGLQQAQLTAIVTLIGAAAVAAWLWQRGSRPFDPVEPAPARPQGPRAERRRQRR